MNCLFLDYLNLFTPVLMLYFIDFFAFVTFSFNVSTFRMLQLEILTKCNRIFSVIYSIKSIVDSNHLPVLCVILCNSFYKNLLN
jgi:hypothetical protein